MAQTLLWLLPDFFGSHLSWVPPGGGSRRVWLDLPTLAADGLDDALRLPGPRFGGSIAAGGMVDYAGFAQTRFRDYLRGILPDDWTLVTRSYDWRQGAQQLGADLAGVIAGGSSQPPGGHRLLGIGYGGLVACACYGALVDMGKANLVPRIVTLGAALAGTYAPVETWRWESNAYNTLAVYQPGHADAFGLGNYPFRRHGREIGTFVTWPSTYDLLPDPAAWDDPGDTYRSQVWQATTWADAVVPPSGPLLDASRTGFRAWINGPGRWPPPGVLVCGVGVGRPTPLRLSLPSPNAAAAAQRLLRGGALSAALIGMGLRQVLAARTRLPATDYGLTESPGVVGNLTAALNWGDGVCTLASQMRPGVQYVPVTADHAALASDPVIRDNLLAMLSGAGLPAGPLDATLLPDWPSYRPRLLPRSVAPTVPALPRSGPTLF